MSSRRSDRQTPDPEEEREMSRGRGRQVQNPEVERDLYDICARLVDMEIKQRRRADVGYISESESEDEVGHGEEEVTAEDAAISWYPSHDQVNLSEACEATLLCTLNAIYSAFVVLKARDLCFVLH
jgi:hypothetical protein